MRPALAALPLLLLAAGSAALDVPFLSGRVNDEAHLLDANANAALEQTLKDYETRTGRQLAVLTIPSLGGEPVEEFSLKVARTWKLGRKGKDDGVLLLVAKAEHKVRIEVGYGLEGDLPDALAGRIITDVIVPRFRAGDFPAGVRDGAVAVIAALDRTPAPPGAPSVPAREMPWRNPFGGARNLIPGFLVLLLCVMMDLDEIPKNGTDVSVYFWVAVMVPVAVSLLFSRWGLWFGAFVDLVHLIGFPAGKYAVHETAWGRKYKKKRKGTHGESAIYFGDPAGGSSSGGGGFSGGGGSFGGGGASGSW